MKLISTHNLSLFICIILFFSSFFVGNVILQIFLFFSILVIYFVPRKDKLLLLRANTAYKRGKYPESFAYHERYIKTPSASVMSKIIYSYRLLMQGELTKSYDILQGIDLNTLTSDEKRNYNAAFGLILFKKHNVNRAIELYETIFHERANQLGYETLGYLYLCAKRYDMALSFNQRAYEAYPKSEWIQSNLGCSYYFKDLYPEAAECFETLISNHTSLLEPYYYYAAMLDQQGDYQEAIDALLEATLKPELYLHQLKQEQIRASILCYQEHMKQARLQTSS